MWSSTSPPGGGSCWRVCVATDQIAHTTHVDDDEVGTGPPHHPAEMCDHFRSARRAAGVAADCVKRRLRAWHSAIAIASLAWSSSLPSGNLTCAESIREICALSALP